MQWLDAEAPVQNTRKCLFPTIAATHNRLCKFIRSQIEGVTEMNTETIEDLPRMLKTGTFKLGDNWEEIGITFGGASADSGGDSQDTMSLDI